MSKLDDGNSGGAAVVQYKDNESVLHGGADVTWVAGDFAGYPAIVVRADGPVWAAGAVSIDHKNLLIKVAMEFAADVPDTARIMVCEEGRLDAPILTADPTPELINTAKQAETGGGWLLIKEFMIEGEKKSVVWLTSGPKDAEGRRSERLPDLDNSEIHNRWFTRD